MSLKTEDVKVGDKLACIDEDAWINGFSANRKLLSKEYVVFGISKNNEYVFISDNQLTSESILSKELKYFKKKEQSQYTFDDAVSAAMQAWKDDVAASPTFDKKGNTLFIRIRKDIYDNGSKKFSCSEVSKALDYIQSLYKETFVIECEDDIKRIRSYPLNKEPSFDSDKAPKATLSNGNVIHVFRKDKDSDHVCVYMRASLYKNYLDFEVLKGATVEQERGCDE